MWYTTLDQWMVGGSTRLCMYKSVWTTSGNFFQWWMGTSVWYMATPDITRVSSWNFCSKYQILPAIKQDSTRLCKVLWTEWSRYLRMLSSMDYKQKLLISDSLVGSLYTAAMILKNSKLCLPTLTTFLNSSHAHHRRSSNKSSKMICFNTKWRVHPLRSLLQSRPNESFWCQYPHTNLRLSDK